MKLVLFAEWFEFIFLTSNFLILSILLSHIIQTHQRNIKLSLKILSLIIKQSLQSGWVPFSFIKIFILMQSEKQEKILPDEQNIKEDANSDKESEQFDYDDDTPFNLPPPTKLDLKSFWLGNTDDLIKKFDTKLGQLKIEQEGISAAFKLFNQNIEKYKLSSLRKIKIEIDPKELYNQYLLKTRKQIEKISPTLLINIFAYTDENLFLALVKARRISKIFNQIYKNQSIQSYLAEKDYLQENLPHPRKKSIQMCSKYLAFKRTFLTYKNIHYTENFPQNSLTVDFANAINFINFIHKIVYEKKSRDFTYFQLVNSFMTKNRVVIGLSSLSLTSLVLVRKAAIIAFSNYLALNVDERSHEQITKTKYSKVISVVQHENYKDTLIINTKVSNYLLENYKLNFAVFITNYNSVVEKKPEHRPIKSWNILVFHRRNDLKNFYLQNIELKKQKYQSSKLDIEFSEDMSWCGLSAIEFQRWVKVQGKGRYLVSLLENEEQGEYFCFCWVYHLEEYYLIAMPAEAC